MAYGQRAMPKLVEVLSLPELDDDCTVRCLKLLASLISSQASYCDSAVACNSALVSIFLVSQSQWYVQLIQMCRPHSSSCEPQEAKAQAVSAKAVQCVVPLVSSANLASRQLSCQVLASLAQLFQGRMAVLQSDGIAAVVSALDRTADEGACFLQVCRARPHDCTPLL